MSRTGSTSEQKPPTRWQARLRRVLLASLLLVAAAPARAGWQGLDTLAPGGPVIDPSRSISVRAGSGTQILKAQASCACVITSYRWTRLSPGSPELGGGAEGGARVEFPVPETVCEPLGESHLYRVEAIDDGGLISPPTDVTIQVLPWGAPREPFQEDRVVDLSAGPRDGGRVVLTPETPGHVCDTPDAGFPGVDTVWEIKGGAPVPPGVRLLAEEGGFVVGSFAVTPALRIETAECTRAQFELAVQHYTRNSFGDGGPVSTVHVNVEPDLSPPSELALALTALPATPDLATGVALVSGIPCTEEQEELGLQARIVLRHDGELIREGIFPVPGPWQFTLGDVCHETTYELQGELLVKGLALPGGGPGTRGPHSSVVVGGPVRVPPVQQPKLQRMEAPRLTAHCGGQATGVLEQRPLRPCTELPISWEQAGGTPLTLSTSTGQRIEVATQDTDFAALIGQSVRLRMRARTVEESLLEQSVPILADPFIELHRRIEKETGAGAEPVGVTVELRNTTECGVREVDHQERFEGVDYVPGSARFNGTPVEAEVGGDRLTVRGLVLEGGTTGLLTYVVRPRLLGGSRFEGQSFIREVLVSQPVEDPPAGCGCSGGGSGVAALGLAGLAVALRRRWRR